mmetsp:Transcript_27943/g.88955  ORF Transcript_27943/g.88955 Transcript_27943/m.88955 type:complete len:250 (+) Transcript_27943:1935-2684(+)
MILRKRSFSRKGKLSSVGWPDRYRCSSTMPKFCGGIRIPAIGGGAAPAGRLRRARLQGGLICGRVRGEGRQERRAEHAPPLRRGRARVGGARTGHLPVRAHLRARRRHRQGAAPDARAAAPRGVAPPQPAGRSAGRAPDQLRHGDSACGRAGVHLGGPGGGHWPVGRPVLLPPGGRRLPVHLHRTRHPVPSRRGPALLPAAGGGGLVWRRPRVPGVHPPARPAHRRHARQLRIQRCRPHPGTSRGTRAG